MKSGFLVQKSMGDFIFETMKIAASVWILEPLLVYCYLSITKSDAAHPLIFSAANLVGNFTSLAVLSSSQELTEVIIYWIGGIVSKFRDDIVASEVRKDSHTNRFPMTLSWSILVAVQPYAA